MGNLDLYNSLRSCPHEAQKPITAGRLKGMTDINPMWRIKAITDRFGKPGFGWTLKIVRTWVEEGAAGERTANVEIEFRYKDENTGEWSAPIPGIGGSMLIENERNGPHTCDECYKKAFTDAQSVAFKTLGLAADIYFAKDPDSKYPTGDQNGDILPFSPVHKPQVQSPQMTYEQALSFVLPSGRYPGLMMSEIYKTDIEYINELGRSPDTDPAVIQAISIINAEIKKARAKKAGG